MSAPKKNNAGRKSLYETKWKNKLHLIEKWISEEGLFDHQLAQRMGIGHSTIYEWQGKYPEFAEVMKKAKDRADELVENALFKRAIGYEYTEVVKERAKNGRLVVVKETVKENAPNVTAQIFWLQNRKPDQWKDRRAEGGNEKEITIKLGNVIMEERGND